LNRVEDQVSELKLLPLVIVRLIVQYQDFRVMSFYKLEGTDASVSHVANDSYVLRQVADGNERKVLLLRNGTVAVPAIPRFTTSSFTISVWVKLLRLAGHQPIFGDWTRPWSWRLYIHDAQATLTLRRNINSNGSQADQDMISITGGRVMEQEWFHLCTIWDRSTRQLSLFINGKKIGTAQSIYSDPDIQANDHQKFHIGWKQDGHERFDGEMYDLRVFDEVLKQHEVLAVMGRVFVAAER